MQHVRKFGGVAYYYQSTENSEVEAKAWAADFRRHARYGQPPVLVRVVKEIPPGRRKPVWHIYTRANPKHMPRCG